jgi:hypothetical protein
MLYCNPVGLLARAVAASVATFRRDETGAEEGMNKLLIFALVALPLLALLIFFGGEIIDLAQEKWNEVVGGNR